MKTTTSIKKMSTAFTLFLLAIFSSVYAFAQDVPSKVDVDISTDGGSVWYGQPWVWAVGVGLFILILVIITRSNKSAE